MVKGLYTLTFSNGNYYFLHLPYEHLCVLGDPGPRGKTGPQAMANLLAIICDSFLLLPHEPLCVQGDPGLRGMWSQGFMA